MHPHDAYLGLAVPAPDAFHDLICGEDNSGGAHQQLHHLIFAPAQAHGLRTTAEHPAAALHAQITHRQPLRPVLPAAAQHRAQPAQQLVRCKGLGQIIVRARVKAGDAVVLLSLCGQEHDRRRDAVLTQAAEYLKAVQLRHHYIEDYRIIRASRRVLISVRAVMHGVYRIQILFQKDAQRLGEVFFIFRDQELHNVLPLYLFYINKL